MIEDPCRHVALPVRQGFHGVVEMGTHDGLGAAEGIERRQAKHLGALPALGIPEPLHHELEVRRLDRRRIAIRSGAERIAFEAHATGLHLVEDGLDEVGLDLDVRLRELVVPCEGPEDGLAGGSAIETLEGEIVAEHVRNPPGENVELGECVLPECEQDVHPQMLRTHYLGELGRDCLGIRIDEQLLELIEHEVDLSREAAGGDCQPVCQGGTIDWRLDAESGGDGTCDLAPRIARPRIVDDDCRIGGHRPQPANDTCPQHRALSNAQRPVEDREAGCHEVRGDRVRVSFAPEEEKRVEVTVLEGR